MLTDYALAALCLWFTATLWRRSKLWVAAFLVTAIAGLWCTMTPATASTELLDTSNIEEMNPWPRASPPEFESA